MGIIINYMSRIGKRVIKLPDKVTAEIKDGGVVVTGPKGELKYNLPGGLKINREGSNLVVECEDSSAGAKSAWGTSRAIIADMVQGVVEGYEKKLEIEGVGFKVQLQGDKLTLNVGFSHPMEFKAPAGVTLQVDKNTILISGVDKFLVGEVAANIRQIRKPEPYKGKGIRYAGEVVRRKAGKKATASA